MTLWEINGEYYCILYASVTTLSYNAPMLTATQEMIHPSIHPSVVSSLAEHSLQTIFSLKFTYLTCHLFTLWQN